MARRSRPVQRSERTPSGKGHHRVVELTRSLKFTPADLETRPEFVHGVLLRSFKRKFLYDWYSRNHRRYKLASLSIEARVVPQNDPELSLEIVKFSKTHDAQEKAGDFFDSAVTEIVEFMIGRKYSEWFVHTLITTMWFHRK